MEEVRYVKLQRERVTFSRMSKVAARLPLEGDIIRPLLRQIDHS